MEISGGPQKPKGPFKFSSSWLKDPTYNQMLKQYWKAHPPGVGGNITEGFTHNLMELKRLSKTWAHNKRIKDDQSLLKAEEEIAEIEKDLVGAYIVSDQRNRLIELYTTRRKILKDHEEV